MFRKALNLGISAQSEEKNNIEKPTKIGN